MANEDVFFTYGVLEFLDDTGTPLELVQPLADGAFSLPYKFYANETLDIQSTGKHRSTGPGQREYYELTVTAMIDRLAGSSVNGINDFIGGTSGGTYASRVLTDANSPVPHLHARFTYTLPSTATVVIGLEDCEILPTAEMAGSLRLNLRLRIKGRIFMDGQCVSAEYGTARTAPSWLTA